MAVHNWPSLSGLKVRLLIVSGFLTSPNDHERIRSGEASAILIASKSSAGRCWLNRFRRSFMFDSGIRDTRFGIGYCGNPAMPDSPPQFLRSEEHTSELQSLMRISYAVFCLKKKK